jgi:transcriptional regulator with XRE-family HTH domain
MHGAVQLYYLIVHRGGNEVDYMTDFDFGEYIREERKKKGWDQIEAAKRSNLSKWKFARIERGEILPDIGEVDDIFDAFELPRLDIGGKKPEEKPLTARDCLNKLDYYLSELRRMLGQ